MRINVVSFVYELNSNPDKQLIINTLTIHTPCKHRPKRDS